MSFLSSQEETFLTGEIPQDCSQYSNSFKSMANAWQLLSQCSGVILAIFEPDISGVGLTGLAFLSAEIDELVFVVLSAIEGLLLSLVGLLLASLLLDWSFAEGVLLLVLSLLDWVCCCGGVTVGTFPSRSLKTV